MITDTLSNADKHGKRHPLFQAAFDFLRRPDLDKYPPGRVSLVEDRLIAIVSHDKGRGRSAARLEAHRRFIDIQYVVAGEELIGWRNLASCRIHTESYDPDRDIEFYGDEPALWMPVPCGSYAILYPEDAHAPLAGKGEVHKVVLKIAVT